MDILEILRNSEAHLASRSTDDLLTIRNNYQANIAEADRPGEKEFMQKMLNLILAEIAKRNA